MIAGKIAASTGAKRRQLRPPVDLRLTGIACSGFLDVKEARACRLDLRRAGVVTGTVPAIRPFVLTHFAG
ncbi:MAG: hypothetical protein ACT4OK_04720 [Gemmobacter sp.]